MRGKSSGDTRDTNVDIIRCAAALWVMSVHFFLHNGFYSETVVGGEMFLMVCMRTFFMVCVPLFMILTGYLMGNRKLPLGEKSYYRKLSRVIVPYVIITVMIMIFKKFYFGDELTVGGTVLNILGYNQYTWYVNMYIGLYLLIPFVNLIWNNLPSKKEEKALLITLIVMTILPSLMNIYDFKTPGWWSTPWMSNTYQKLVPDWWRGIYPLTYYFAGAYIKKHEEEIRVKAWMLFGALLLCVLCFGSFNYYRSCNAKFVWGTWCDWYGFQNFTDSVLVFLLLKKIPTEKMPLRAKRMIKRLAELSFGAYMASWMVDRVVYAELKRQVPVMTDRVWYYIPVVLTVFAGAMVLSWMADVIFRVIKKIVLKK